MKFVKYDLRLFKKSSLPRPTERKPCIPNFVWDGVPACHPEALKRRGTSRLTPRGDKKKSLGATAGGLA